MFQSFFTGDTEKCPLYVLMSVRNEQINFIDEL